ncbi:MAG: response regulator [Bacteroidetes bacterium]|jgi:CheY-like chemotaxis protein|nr:response regulator [Bacteroidota bacterium]
MKRKVVIVEDDRLLSIVLKKMAKSMGYEVLATCPGGRNAIDTVEEMNPDLVIMDIMLADVPVVYITAQNDLRIKQEAITVENSAYLLKPVRMNQLQEAIQTVQFAA